MEMEMLISKIHEKFQITVSNGTKYIGMEIQIEGKQVLLTMHSYIQQLLEQYKLNDAKTKRTPGTPGDKMSNSNEKIPFRELLGRLTFISNVIRPDITFEVIKQSRNMNNYDRRNFEEVKRIIRYLKGTMSHGITYYSSNKDEMEITVYSDSGYAGDPVT